MEILAGLAKSKEITASRLAKSTEITSSGLVKSLEIFPGRQYFPARRCYFPELDGISLLFSNQRCYFPKLIWYFPALCGDWFGVPKSNCPEGALSVGGLRNPMFVCPSVRPCVRPSVRQNRHFCEGDMKAWQAYTYAWIYVKWLKNQCLSCFGDMFFSSCEGDRHPGCPKKHGFGSWFFHLAKVIVIQVSQKRSHKEPLRGHPALRV